MTCLNEQPTMRRNKGSKASLVGHGKRLRPHFEQPSYVTGTMYIEPVIASAWCYERTATAWSSRTQSGAFG
jgi:hypothetical protein